MLLQIIWRNPFPPPPPPPPPKPILTLLWEKLKELVLDEDNLGLLYLFLIIGSVYGIFRYAQPERTDLPYRIGKFYRKNYKKHFRRKHKKYLKSWRSHKHQLINYGTAYILVRAIFGYIFTYELFPFMYTYLGYVVPYSVDHGIYLPWSEKQYWTPLTPIPTKSARGERFVSLVRAEIELYLDNGVPVHEDKIDHKNLFIHRALEGFDLERNLEMEETWIEEKPKEVDEYKEAELLLLPSKKYKKYKKYKPNKWLFDLERIPSEISDEEKLGMSDEEIKLREADIENNIRLKAWFDPCTYSWVGDIDGYYVPVFPVDKLAQGASKRDAVLKDKYFQRAEFIKDKQDKLVAPLTQLVVLQLKVKNGYGPMDFLQWVILRSIVANLLDEVEETFGEQKPKVVKQFAPTVNRYVPPTS